MHTVSDCRTTTGDIRVANTTKRMASLSLDQFVKLDESGKSEKECLAGFPDETRDEAEEKKEDVMLKAPEIFSKSIMFLAPVVTPSPVVDNFRPPRLFMESEFARCQRMKKEHDPAAVFMSRMGGTDLRSCIDPPFDFSPSVVPMAVFSYATKGRDEDELKDKR
ncbi:uncharacterized protein LOC131302008 [Rhododendron vialii]|uniref:uncharacterized protein LOC131302008 n=1 Tax=Rhododendron vialii TaxID=182163 RepID=UPI00265D779E|nr:uncharacterized protein LOC131302008 [Rhododendron vialii]